jgi:fumarate reductase subunit C
MIAQAGLSDKPLKSRLPARLDIAQSLTGLVLVVFMWGHMFFIMSILFGDTSSGTKVFDEVAKMFEGGYFFEHGHPGIVSLIVAIVAIIIICHAALAIRKFPINYRQFKTFRAHAKMMHHKDTSLWMWQVYTGFAMFFLASAHIYQMLVFPSFITAEASGARMMMLWPFYCVLLLAVELHGGIGLYRLWVKWDIFSVSRAFRKKCETAIMAVFLIIGFLSMFAFLKVGYDYKTANNGQLFSPTFTTTGSTAYSGKDNPLIEKLMHPAQGENK